MRRTLGVFRFLILSISFLTGIQIPTVAYAQDSDRVYLESDCLEVLGASRRLPAAEKSKNPNETIVEEDKGLISFERVTVIEKREGAVAESYVQVRNCRLMKSAKPAQE